MMNKKTKPTRAPKVSKRQENPSPEDDSPPFVIINISAENAELDGDIRQNNKVETNVEPSRDPLPDFLADNPFISGSIGETGGSDPTFSLSPEDVMTILSIMNTGNTGSPATTTSTDPVFTTCPAATICVERSRCDFNGVVSDQTVRLTPRLVNMQVALNVSCWLDRLDHIP